MSLKVKMEIRIGSLTHHAVIALLEHHQDMLLHSPEESVHALDLSALTQEGILFGVFGKMMH